jgi:hypothetical protein
MKKITFKYDVKNFDGCSYKYRIFYDLTNGFLNRTIKTPYDIIKLLCTFEMVQFCIYEINEIINKLRHIFEDELFMLLFHEIDNNQNCISHSFLNSTDQNIIKKKRIPILRYGARGLNKTINTDNLPLINKLLGILYEILNR